MLAVSSLAANNAFCQNCLNLKSQSIFILSEGLEFILILGAPRLTSEVLIRNFFPNSLLLDFVAGHLDMGCGGGGGCSHRRSVSGVY